MTPGNSTFPQMALDADEDIETIIATPVRTAAGKQWAFRGDVLGASTSVELNAFDAVILGSVPLSDLPDDLLKTLEHFVSRRGGGLCMIGGPASFAAGQWNDSVLEKLSPLAFDGGMSDWQPSDAKFRIVEATDKHPIWRMAADPRQNQALLADPPACQGLNRLKSSKPGATVLAEADLVESSASSPIIAVQPFGRGRTMAVATAVATSHGVSRDTFGGVSQLEGNSQFWRTFWINSIYWLTENSQIGRRRLVVEADKRLYRPGEKILVRAETFDSSGSQIAGYRVLAMVEPATMLPDASEALSPITRSPEEQVGKASSGRFLSWGEEIPMHIRADGLTYEKVLQIGNEEDLRELATASVHALRVEVTAFDDYAPVDSTSVSVQILNDPDEFHTPLPNHAAMEDLAKTARGKVLRDAPSLFAAIGDLPVTQGPPKIAQLPILNNAWVFIVLLVVLSCEWVWRRMIGLA
jgi:uncharacterized membrane protein